MSLKQPIGQKRLTNVALVRYKKKGKRFEIACYKNKVVNWRAGVEKDLDEVLQTTAVFANVSKGVLAKHEDLVDVFGTDNEEKICVKILNEGDYQVSDKERDLELDSLFRDVASVLAEKCVNPQTNRPYTISMLERALKDIHFSVDPKRAAKQQALEVLPKLKGKIPIERARMRLKTQVPKSRGDVCDQLLELLKLRGALVESRDTSDAQEVVVCQVDPSCYRDIHNFVQRATDSHGQVEVVSLGVVEQGEAHSQFEPWGASQVAAAAKGSAQDRSDNGAHLGSGKAAPGDASGNLSAPYRTEKKQQAAEAMRREPAAADEVLYPRGPVSELPDEFESRRERFMELDGLEAGWRVQLCKKRGGSTVDAVFYSPSGGLLVAGEKVGSFAIARRAALQAHKRTQESRTEASS